MSNPSIDYQCVLKDLRARRDRMTAAIEAVEQIIGELHPNGSQASTVSAPVAVSHVGSDIYRTMTIKDACIHFLRANGGVQPTTALVQALRTGGIKSQSKSLYRTVYNILTEESKREDGKIVRREKGWGLREKQA